MTRAGRITVILERSASPGGIKVTSPALPGWACGASNLNTLGSCIDAAWREHEIAAYAADRGEPYDAAHLADAAHDPDADRVATWIRWPDGSWTSPTGLKYAAGTPRACRREEILAEQGPPPTRRVVSNGRPIWRLSHDPAEWTPLPGGDWRSPSGRRYRADSVQVERVKALRVAANLPVGAPVEHEDTG